MPAKRMYTMGNYSRFIRPNYYRIGLTGGIAVISAYKDSASPSFAIVAINRDPINSINQVFQFFQRRRHGLGVTPWITSSNLSLAKQTAVCRQPIHPSSTLYSRPTAWSPLPAARIPSTTRRFSRRFPIGLTNPG